MNNRLGAGKGKKRINWENEVGFFHAIVLLQRFRPHPTLLYFISIPPVKKPPCFKPSTIVFWRILVARDHFQTYLSTTVDEFLYGFRATLQVVSGKVDLSHSIFLTCFHLSHGRRVAFPLKNPHNLTFITIAINLIAPQRCNEPSYHSYMMIIFSLIQYNIYLGPYGTGPDVAMHGEMKDVSPPSVQSCNA